MCQLTVYLYTIIYLWITIHFNLFLYRIYYDLNFNFYSVFSIASKNSWVLKTYILNMYFKAYFQKLSFFYLFLFYFLCPLFFAEIGFKNHDCLKSQKYGNYFYFFYIIYQKSLYSSSFLLKIIKYIFIQISFSLKKAICEKVYDWIVIWNLFN